MKKKVSEIKVILEKELAPLPQNDQIYLILHVRDFLEQKLEAIEKEAALSIEEILRESIREGEARLED